MGSEWTTTTLGAIGRIVTGKTPPTADKDNYGGDIPFVTPSDMDGRKRISRTGRYLTAKGFDCVKSSAVPRGSVMVSCIGSDMGKSVIAESDCVSNQQINSIVLKQDVYAEYVYYDLSQRKEELQRLACSGSAQPILNKGHFSQLPILLPPLPEQKAIANILGSLDDKIELNRRTNDTLEAMARAIFKSWFVDFDAVQAKSEGRQPYGMDAETAKLFPSSFEGSEIGRVPKGWRVGSFGDIASSRREIADIGDFPPETAYIGLEHMPRRSIALSDWGDTSSVESAKSRFSKGDVLFGKLRPYFHKVGIAPVDGVCSTDILVIVPKAVEWSAFTLGYASSDEMVDYADGCSTGTRMPRVSWDDLSRYRLPIPPPQLAEQLTRALAPVFDAVVANIHECCSLSLLREALLPRLISGELAIPALMLAS